MGEAAPVNSCTPQFYRPREPQNSQYYQCVEWLCMEVLKKVPHRHFILSIPKILLRYFLYDRKLLSYLSRCAWEALKEFYQVLVDEEEYMKLTP